jgi:hypothetical protein
MPVPGGISPVKPVMPPAPVLPGAKPSPGVVLPVSPIKPIIPGAVAPLSPVKPIVPAATPATAVIAPPPPGNMPLKPASSTSASTPEPNAKTGTSIVKSAPPKETARITVKPNLPSTAVRTAGNFPIAKPTAGAVPVVAAAAGAAVAGAAVAAKAVAKPGVASSKPATTIVKTGTTTARASAIKPVAGTAAPAVAAAPIQFQDESSTTVTTVLAGVLALLTWGTALVLIASYLAWI